MSHKYVYTTIYKCFSFSWKRGQLTSPLASGPTLSSKIRHCSCHEAYSEGVRCVRYHSECIYCASCVVKKHNQHKDDYYRYTIFPEFWEIMRMHMHAVVTRCLSLPCERLGTRFLRLLNRFRDKTTPTTIELTTPQLTKPFPQQHPFVF